MFLSSNLKTYKVSILGQCSKRQLIPLQNFIINTCFIRFLWFFRLKCWFKGQIIPRIHLSLPNAYKLMCFDRNINGNRDVKFFVWDYWSLHWRKKLTLVTIVDNSFTLNYSIQILSNIKSKGMIYCCLVWKHAAEKKVHKIGDIGKVRYVKFWMENFVKLNTVYFAAQPLLHR